GQGGGVSALLLGNKAKSLAEKLNADKVIYFEHTALTDFSPEPYLQLLKGLITKYQPRIVLFGSTSIGSDIAGPLSIQLGLPLISSCRTLGENGTFTSQICGGKIMAEGVLSDTTTLITIIPGGYPVEQGQKAQSPTVEMGDLPEFESPRVILKKYIEPETGDVDISKENILVAVGRGIQNQDNIELVEQLAKSLNGVVCASRPVIDQGWLPVSRLVGKSGKYVKSKLYLAMGISGAPEHTEAITSSDMIIAINTDPKAPIFNIAKYGIVMDHFDLIEVLTGKISQAKA
ncbi:MAG: electron transfer flavoprotein subunit alpha/FixB family protein, partial [Anaerolineaceae bacterium]